MCDDSQSMLRFAPRKVPGSNEVDATVLTAADPVEGEGKLAEGIENGIFIVGTDIGSTIQR